MNQTQKSIETKRGPVKSKRKGIQTNHKEQTIGIEKRTTTTLKERERTKTHKCRQAHAKTNCHKREPLRAFDLHDAAIMESYRTIRM